MKNSRTLLMCTLLVMGSFGLAACDDDDNNGGGGPAVTPPGPFEFRSEPAAMYIRIDRMGQPATGTALLSRAPGSAPANPKSNVFNNFNNQRDVFNRDDPADDNANFVPPAAATLTLIHVELAPAVRALGLTTCSTGVGAMTEIAQCAAQAVPVISPDVITLNLAMPDGWPNGRRYDDNVINRLLSAALLDLRVHPITLLETLPLNPRSNDARPAGAAAAITTLHVPAADQDISPPAFPYIRPAHQTGV